MITPLTAMDMRVAQPRQPPKIKPNAANRTSSVILVFLSEYRYLSIKYIIMASIPASPSVSDS